MECATIVPPALGGSAIDPMQPSGFGESSGPTHEILRESEERFRLLVEGVKDYAIFMLDADGYITTWNLGAQRIKGYESEEIIGEHFSIFYTDEDVERGHPEEELRIAAADGSYEEEGIRVRKDGSHFWASVLITALRNEEGDLRGFAKVTRDITARKVAEERERLLTREQAALERATDILESISDAFFAVDEECRFTYVNGKAEQFWGRSREGLSVYFQDVTERKLAEESLRRVTEAERKRIARDLHDSVLQDFSYTTAALGMMVLQAKDATSRDQLQAAVDAVRRGSQGLREVVNNLRLEDEEDRPFPEIVGALVRQSRTMAQRPEISLEVGEQIPSAPLGETGTQVSRIIQEALTNARRHSEARRVSVSVKMDRGDLLVEVSDDGRGFGAESSPGVGTSSMHERAALIGGELVIESEVEQGTRVRLRVPLPQGVLE